MHRLFKENGENCQFSYVRLLDRWLISSKNVTLLLRNLEELSCYPDKVRYIWPRIIASAWFSEGLSSEELKDFLSTHTIIGEYCGNSNYQHVTRYLKQEIIFYAIVNNNSPGKCLPVEFSRQFFLKHGLRFVQCESSKYLETCEEYH